MLQVFEYDFSQGSVTVVTSKDIHLGFSPHSSHPISSPEEGFVFPTELT